MVKEVVQRNQYQAEDLKKKNEESAPKVIGESGRFSTVAGE